MCFSWTKRRGMTYIYWLKYIEDQCNAIKQQTYISDREIEYYIYNKKLFKELQIRISRYIYIYIYI